MTEGKQKKGEKKLKGEESLIHILFSFANPSFCTVLLTNFLDVASSSSKMSDKEIQEKIREWDLKLIRGEITEEEYISGLNKLSGNNE